MKIVWTVEERELWINEYLAKRPVLLPFAEHDEGDCGYCDMLRELMREAEKRSSTAKGDAT